MCSDGFRRHKTCLPSSFCSAVSACYYAGVASDVAAAGVDAGLGPYAHLPSQLLRGMIPAPVKL
jgi:hypothetical protein